MITGWGVAEAVKHYYTIFGGELRGKRVIVQGWGNVGSAAAYYLAKEGAKITGIIDRDGGLLNTQGFDFSEIKNLFLQKDGNKLRAENLIPFAELNQNIWSSGAEVFVPCAASRLVQKDQAESLIANGLEVISCGANVPFADPEIFFGPIADFVDGKVSLIPDFIANCGMARVFAYLMGTNVEMSDKAIFTDTSEIIRKAIVAIHNQSANKTGIAKRGFEIALNQLL
jgi:glutamate dehydrogenase/leucine dehydrogenase